MRTVSEGNQRNVIVADLHGDPAALRTILLRARLVDGAGNWVGGGARLVQLGDCVDRGPDSEGVLDQLARLALEAEDAGGAVVRLAGNHEMELMRGETRYARNLQSVERVADRLLRDAAEGRLLAAALAGPWLCAHAGLRTWLRELLEEEVLATGLAPGLEGVVARANQVFVEAAQARCFEHPMFGMSGLFWTYADTLVGSDRALEVPQVNGHTVCASPFTRGHRALFLDRGASVAMRDAPAYLELEGESLEWHFRHHDGQWRSVQAPASPGGWAGRTA